MSLVIRAAEPDDSNFVHKTWFKQHARHPDMQRVDMADYRFHQDQIIKALCQGDTLLVATDDQHPDYIAGFVAFEQVGTDLVVDYVYARGQLGREVQELLLDTAFALASSPSRIVYTHQHGLAGAYIPFLKHRRT